MSVRRHVLLAVLLMLLATGGAIYSAAALAGPGPAGDSLRLVCPLH